MKKSQLRSLVAECISEVVAEDNIDITNEGFKDTFKKFMGTGWDQAKAEQAYNQSYAKRAPETAAKLGVDVATLKAALIKFMMENGGLAVLGGDNKNADWDSNSKSFKRKAGLSKSPSSGGTSFSESKK